MRMSMRRAEGEGVRIHGDGLSGAVGARGDGNGKRMVGVGTLIIEHIVHLIKMLVRPW